MKLNKQKTNIHLKLETFALRANWHELLSEAGKLKMCYKRITQQIRQPHSQGSGLANDPKPIWRIVKGSLRLPRVMHALATLINNLCLNYHTVKLVKVSLDLRYIN